MGTNIQQRLFVFLGVVVLAILFLLPTALRDSMPANWISKPLGLGLDLKGGVHLVYEVEGKEAVKSRAQSLTQMIREELRGEKVAVTRARVSDAGVIEITLLSARTLESAKDKIQKEHPKLAFDGQEEEGERIKLKYSIRADEAAAIEREAVKRAVETLRNRVDQFGVAEPLIQQAGESRILLQMPGVTDIDSVKKIVGSVAKLEFRLVPLSPTADNSVKMKDKQGGFTNVEDHALMTGEAVEKAMPSHGTGQVEVSLVMTSEGARTFRKITQENVGRQLAIILDGVVYSSPVIREAIGGGQASITGGFSFQEASQLALVLRSGALPAPLKVMEERTVGPTLGQESIEKGVTAILAGFVLIVIFMLVYYGKSGVVAVGSLALNLFLLMASLSAFGATLTLPGLAGLALTAGMAVDSNVIIFERIKDELRNGSTRDVAVSAGFDKALTAILDANLTTLLTGIVLYAFGTGPIRGFAVTLSVGILTTLFCATFVARLAFDYFELKGRNGLSV